MIFSIRRSFLGQKKTVHITGVTVTDVDCNENHIQNFPGFLKKFPPVVRNRQPWKKLKSKAVDWNAVEKAVKVDTSATAVENITPGTRYAAFLHFSLNLNLYLLSRPEVRRN